MVDGIFVGRFLGSDALAAINLIMPIIMIATGASVNISMLLGKHEREEASAVFSFSVKFILTLGLVKTLKLKAPGTVSPKTSP